MEVKIPTYCFQCNCGPDLLKVVVRNGVAAGIEPNFDAAKFHPAEGRVCAKAYSLIYKLYNPKRIKSPMVRTNSKKGWNEDPKWREISWDEALEILAEKLIEIRRKGLLDENGRPRLAVTMGAGGTPEGHFGSFPAFMSAYGWIDMSVGSGQGVKCYHSEHVYGELWHRSFIAAPDTPYARLIISFGANVAASRGASGNWRHANARVKSCKRIQFEPHLSVTGAVSDEWISIKPKTDAAFLYAMIHVILHEMDWRKLADIDFLKKMTNSPYLVSPNGYFMRDSESRKPLIWDPIDGKAKVFDDSTIKDFALERTYKIDGIEEGPDGEVWRHKGVEVKPSFQLLIEHMKKYTPEWASKICEVPAETIRRVSKEYVENAMVGATIKINGEDLPYRPVAIELGKTVNNGLGGYQTCWARSILAILVGALEVPGGTLGIGARINPPFHDKWQSVLPGLDGFMNQVLNPTDRESWPTPPHLRAGLTELTPLIGVRGWAQAISPSPLAWLFIHETPENWRKVNPPDVWIVYRCNPVISYHDTKLIVEAIKKFPFIVSIAYTIDETTWFADLVLPDHIDLESLQLFRIGGLTHSFESFWEYYGFAIKQPVVKPLYYTKDMTDIWTELAARVGILHRYNEAIDRGFLGAPLKGSSYDYKLDLNKKYSREEIWDRVCKAVTRTLSNGKEEKDLEWFKKNGFYFIKFPKIRHYLHPIMVKWGLRYELPYQERIKRIGEELKNRLHERGIRWWDDQLKEYEALSKCEDFSEIWREFYGPEYDLWAVTTRSLQYAFGANVSNPLSSETSKLTIGVTGVGVNPKTAKEKGIKDGDTIIIESPRRKVEAKAVVHEGVRPDCIVFVGQFGHRVTPHAKNLKIPNINQLAVLNLKLVDATGSLADLVRVKVSKLES
ncbi:MAG: molybdopterin-dependent oxidoreductase [Candidatus Heimdallarchaeota archaeon]